MQGVVLGMRNWVLSGYHYGREDGDFQTQKEGDQKLSRRATGGDLIRTEETRCSSQRANPSLPSPVGGREV